MSIFDGQLNRIRPDEIGMLLEHNDIKAHFYSCPCEADIMLGDIISINFSSMELAFVDITKDSVEIDLIKAITDKINDFTTYVREEVVSEIRLLNSTTINLINTLREKAYVQFNNDSPETVSREDFLKNQYQDKALMMQYLDPKNYEYLEKRDPYMHFDTKTFAFNKEAILKEQIENVKVFLSRAIENSTPKHYDMAIGLMISEFTGKSPETIINRYKKTGPEALTCNIENVTLDVIKKINDLYFTVDLETLINKGRNVSSGKALLDSEKNKHPDTDAIEKTLKNLNLLRG